MHGDWSAASGHRLGSELDVRPDVAVFVGNDQMSIGLFSALRERGLRVPEDVSVIGFDDVPEAGYLFPPLTTVRQDFDTLGELIMQKVLIAVEESAPLTEDTPAPDAPDPAAVDPGDRGLSRVGQLACGFHLKATLTTPWSPVPVARWSSSLRWSLLMLSPSKSHLRRRLWS